MEEQSHQPKLIKRLARKKHAARLVILLENLVMHLWRLCLWCLLFVSLWLLVPVGLIGKPISIFTALIFWGGVSYFLYKDVRHIKIPRNHQINRRLEKASDLNHRPIEALQDTLANPAHLKTRNLWAQYKISRLNLVKSLKIPKPEILIAEADQYALRIAVLLLFVIAVSTAGTNWQQNIKKGLFPYGAGQKNIPLTLWITPPTYTGMDIITTQNTDFESAVTIPQGSTIKARLSTPFSQPFLYMGDTKTPFKKTGPRSWQIETEIRDTKALKVKQLLFTRYNMPVHYKEDTPPQISMAADAKPILLPKGALQFPLIVRDDYGIRNLEMTMTLDQMVTEKPLGDTIVEKRPFSSIPDEDTELVPYYDLTWHPWAGLPVTFTFTAEDDLGQKTSLPPIKMTLPERKFEHPLAKILIEMRQKLSWSPDVDTAHEMAMALEQILPYPDQYHHDLIAFLSMRSMASRMLRDPRLENIQGIISQLWDTALRIEDGNLSLAARKLRDAQQNLQSLLDDKTATDEQIASAVAELRQAMAEYFQELAREMQKRMAEGGPMPMMPNDMMQSLNADDLAAFLDQLQSESLSGDRGKAMDMLSRLEEMMNTLDPAMNAQMPPNMKFMQEGINELQELIEKQQALLDQTLRQVDLIHNSEPQSYGEIIPQENNMPDMDMLGTFDLPQPQEDFTAPEAKRPDINTQSHKTEQDALRYVLGQLMLEADKKLNEIPENMQKAEREMRMSGSQLGENQPELSVPHQEQALKYLKEAEKQMTQQFMAMMQQMQMMSFGPGQTDPFGRPMQQGNGPSWLQGDKVKVPDKAERKRAQEILKELRERSGDRSRPNYELDYYNRLMRQF
jgi:uncharacterized protein (TIGR02302 family)